MGHQHPDLHQRLPVVSACPACTGGGVWRGLFHSSVCETCGGAGIVDTASGEALEPAVALAVLRAALARRTAQLRSLRRVPGVQEAVQADRAEREREAVLPTGRYHGD